MYDLSPTMNRQVNIVAAVGLAVGGVFGLLGSVVAQRNLI
jgi:hypothetical protein